MSEVEEIIEDKIPTLEELKNPEHTDKLDEETTEERKSERNAGADKGLHLVRREQDGLDVKFASKYEIFFTH